MPTPAEPETAEMTTSPGRPSSSARAAWRPVVPRRPSGSWAGTGARGDPAAGVAGPVCCRSTRRRASWSSSPGSTPSSSPAGCGSGRTGPGRWPAPVRREREHQTFRERLVQRLVVGELLHPVPGPGMRVPVLGEVGEGHGRIDALPGQRDRLRMMLDDGTREHRSAPMAQGVGVQPGRRAGVAVLAGGRGPGGGMPESRGVGLLLADHQPVAVGPAHHAVQRAARAAGGVDELAQLGRVHLHLARRAQRRPHSPEHRDGVVGRHRAARVEGQQGQQRLQLRPADGDRRRAAPAATTGRGSRPAARRGFARADGRQQRLQHRRPADRARSPGDGRCATVDGRPGRPPVSRTARTLSRALLSASWSWLRPARMRRPRRIAPDPPGDRPLHVIAALVFTSSAQKKTTRFCRRRTVAIPNGMKGCGLF